MLAVVGAQAAIYLFVFYKLAAMLSRRMARMSLMMQLLIVGVPAAVAFISPIDSFDCMDGHALTACAPFTMYVGWYRAPANPEIAWLRARCGDLGW